MGTRWCILGWTSWEREKQKGRKIMNERRKQPLRRAPHGCPSTLTPECRDSRAGTPLLQALGSLPKLEMGSSSLCITRSLPSESFRIPPCSAAVAISNHGLISVMKGFCGSWLL